MAFQSSELLSRHRPHAQRQGQPAEGGRLGGLVRRWRVPVWCAAQTTVRPGPVHRVWRQVGPVAWEPRRTRASAGPGTVLAIVDVMRPWPLSLDGHRHHAPGGPLGPGGLSGPERLCGGRPRRWRRTAMHQVPKGDASAVVLLGTLRAGTEHVLAPPELGPGGPGMTKTSEPTGRRASDSAKCYDENQIRWGKRIRGAGEGSLLDGLTLGGSLCGDDVWV